MQLRSHGRENEVAAEVLYAMTLGTPEIGGVACPPPMMPTGQEFSTTYHTTWSDRRYRAGTPTGFAGPATSWSSRCSSASCDTLVACWLRASSWRAPVVDVDFIGRQLGLDGDDLARYAARTAARHDHLAEMHRLC